MKVVAVVTLVVVIAGATLFLFHGKKGRAPEPLQSPSVPNISMPERVELTTQDKVTIVGDYYAPAATSSRGLLLLHMMPATRISWAPFAVNMQEAGFHVLAIDLRGHGESQGGPPEASLGKAGPDGYKNFSDADHQASHFDVEAAIEFLTSKGVTALALGGASIGANLAMNYAAAHPDTKAVFLLSPGLDYRGVLTESSAKSLSKDQAVYFAASSEDMRSSGQSATNMAAKLFDECQCQKELTRFDAAGHGTTIFGEKPEFMDTIASWLERIIGR